MLKIERKQVEEPKFVKTLLTNPLAALLWLPLRIWLGLEWLDAGKHKIEDPAWTETGLALKGFWERIVQVPEPPARAPIAYDWYRDFIQFLLDNESYTWFAKLVAYGEVLVGIALIIGAFTGIVAFLGGFMNFNFMLAGSASTNPMLFVAAIGLILAWKVSGYIGADYVLLNTLGTPWNRSTVVPQPTVASPQASAAD